MADPWGPFPRLGSMGPCRGGPAPHVLPAMLRMPTHGLTDEAKRNLNLFFRTSAAREIEDDPRSWAVVEWTWGSGPPLRVHLRDEGGEVIDFVMDATGVWQIWREPMDPRTVVASDLTR